MVYETITGEPLVILHIEDNQAHAELVRRSFEEHHVINHIYHVNDGEKALDYLFRRQAYTDPQSSPKPHLILLDLRLPRIDGLEVLQTIKEDQDLKQVPVVILTTSQAEQDLTRAYELYVNSYVTKPVDFDKFSHLMQELGFYWLGWNQQP